MLDPRIAAILNFWCMPRNHPRYGRSRDVWFVSGPEFDAEIRRRFGREIEQAKARRLDHWIETPDGALALVLLLDQFTRNTGRGSGAAFAGDRHARHVAHRALARRHDRHFPVHVRKFFYLPFEHSESLGDQHRSIGLFARPRPPLVLIWAVAHRDTVTRFGRFPHRNAALGRVDTPDEAAYLAGDHQRYGQ
ncbi:MAG: DUF924 domain-containing protein [Alphaproteobacteria bacterium]|nr:DUF924 domain-containing protein [Alphaproteobacteria bacterium]MCW5741715.1 DUF924 domain-containing protein [Alphaproteobacteria bacterium]